MALSMWLMATVVALFIAGAGTVRAEPYKSAEGPYAAEIIRGTWTDPTRKNREIPYKIYAPDGADGERPVIIFSHGLGGTREGGTYLGLHLASHGHVAVHLQHVGSDASIWQGQPLDIETARKSVGDVKAAVNRFRDVGFAVDALAAMTESVAKLKGRLDLSRMGISGHSYGAITTLVTAGQKLGRRQMSFADARFKAAIAYSPSPPRRTGQIFGPDLESIYDTMIVPIFHMTGTEDGSPLTDMKPESRRIPFDTISVVDQYLLVLGGGDHAVFSGRRFQGPDKSSDARHHDLIRMASVAFWDAHLLGSDEARRWLEDGGFQSELAAADTFEVKPATSSTCVLNVDPDICEAF